jgi:regulator of nonsense transcripts 2
MPGKKAKHASEKLPDELLEDADRLYQDDSDSLDAGEHRDDDSDDAEAVMDLDDDEEDDSDADLEAGGKLAKGAHWRSTCGSSTHIMQC